MAIVQAASNPSLGVPRNNVRSDRPSTPPLREVVLQLCFEDEVVELLQLHATTT